MAFAGSGSRIAFTLCMAGRSLLHIIAVVGIFGLESVACSRAPSSASGELSKDQQAAVAKIYDTDGRQLADMQQQLISKQGQLGEATAAAQPDQNQVRGLTRDVSRLSAQVQQAEAAMQRRLAAAGCPMCGVPGASGPPWTTGMDWNRLPPDQRTQAETIERANAPKIADLRRQIANKQREWDDAVASPQPDEARIQALTKDLAGLDEQLLTAEAAMRRQLSDAGIPSRGFSICPMCGGMMGNRGWGMMGDHHRMMGGGWGRGPCW